MTAHARLSPSAAARWLKCTAAPTLEANYEDQTSEYAREGTYAHALAELCARYAAGLTTRRTYTKKLNALMDDPFYTPEMFDHCEEYATIVKETLLVSREICPDAFAELEVKLDLSDLIPGGFGTADCVIIAEPVLHVMDFKYGKGVEVKAENNSQMMIYALGALARYGALYDITEVTMTIIQPRIGGASSWTVYADDLEAWGRDVLEPKAKEAYDGPGEFCPGEDTCRFCKAGKDCRARADYYIGMFEDAPESATLTAQEAGDLLERAAGIDDWLKGLQEKVFGAISSGEKVDGWKLVEGRSNRQYVDEEAVATILETETDLDFDQLYVTKLITLTQVEKLLGKKRTAELLADQLVKPKGKPTLVPESDKRPAIHPEQEVIAAFDEV